MSSASSPALRDEPSPTPRPRLGRIVLVVLVVVVALFALGWWNAVRLARERIDEHRQRLAQECVALRAAVRRRPAVLEPFGEGTAEQALAEFEAADKIPSETWDEMGEAFERTEKAPSSTEVDRLLAAHPEVVRALERVLHVESVTVAGTANAPWDRSGVVPWTEGTWVGVAARRHLEGGDRAAALRETAILATLGADFARQGSPSALHLGVELEVDALQSLAAAVATGPIDAADARRVARVLDLLEEHRAPLRVACDVARAESRSSILAASQKDLGKPTWRQFLSLDILRVEYLDVCDETFDAASKTLSAAGERAASTDISYGKAYGWGAYIARRGLSKVRSALREERERRTARRLARVALAVALFRAERGAAPTALDELVPSHLSRVPEDPWAEPPASLRFDPSGLRIWSVGEDHTDNGGTPQRNIDSLTTTGDVVVTVFTPK